MPRTVPEQLRHRGITRVSIRCLATALRVSNWWGLGREDAVAGLDRVRAMLLDPDVPWPEQPRPSFVVGTDDATLLTLAAEGVAALRQQGADVSFRRLWVWCRQQGARKRYSDACRLLRPLVTWERDRKTG
jgi:hypothetical protein